MKKLVLENVSDAEQIGLNVSCIVLDQGVINIGMVNDLGVTTDKPFIVTESGKQIFVMYDYCHLLKSVHNTLLKHDIETNKGNYF